MLVHPRLLLLILALFSSVQSQANADQACPVKVRSIKPIARSADNTAFLYILDIAGVTSEPPAADADLRDKSGRVVAHVNMQGVTWQKAEPQDYSRGMFSWKDNLLQSAAITDVTSPTGAVLLCQPEWSEVSTIEAPLEDIAVLSDIPRGQDGSLIASPTDFADAQFLHREPPDYPHFARDNDVQGSVELTVLVGIDGMPHKVTVYRSSGSKLLDDAAVEAATESTFRPAVLRGKSLQMIYHALYVFSLTD